MDPNACWANLVEALDGDIDYEAALESALNLHEWINRGGFVPQLCVDAGLTASALDAILLSLIDLLRVVSH